MNLRLLLAGAMALVLSASHVCAQSAPGWTTGYKPSAAEWNSAFAAKQNLLGAGSVTASMLATGAAAANLSTMLPNLSASVQGSGVPGLDIAHWRLYNGFSTWDPTPTLRVDRTVSGTQTGTFAGGPYYAGMFQTTTGVNEVAYEWPLFSQVINYTNASTAAQHVAVGGYMLRNPPPNTVATTGASGDGTTATVAFSGGATIPVGHSVKIAGMTPSGYNGNWKVTASSAGSVSFLSATTGAQTVAGTIVDIALSPGWGANFVCTDQAGEPDPITGCVALELDSYTNYSGTDANKSRVTLQMMAGTGHVSRGILQGTKGGATYDRAYELDGTYGIGFDFTNGSFASPAIMLATTQQICFDGTTGGACTRYLTYASGNLTYTVPGGTAFAVGDGGTVGLNRILSNSGNDLKLTANTGNKLQLGLNGVDSVYTLDTTGLYPENDNLRTLGTSALRWSTIYGTGLGASSFPVTNAYITNATLGAVPTLPSQTANTFFAAPNGSAGAPTMRAIVAADLPSTLVATNYTSSGTSLHVTPGSGGVLFLGTNNSADLWSMQSGGQLQPQADNTRDFGATANRIANGYFVNLGASATPIAKVYATQTLTTAALPTISTCGTSPPAASAGSNNSGGQFTLGTGATAACTVTFNTAYPTNAYCTVTPTSAYTGTYYVSAQSRTAFTVTLGTGTASVVFNYSCAGN
jgi:hypothetical protein